MDPIVPKLKKVLKEKHISHAFIAEKMGKHRAFITRKLGENSMETRILEGILEASGMTYQDLFCVQEEVSLREEMIELKKEVNRIKAALPEDVRKKMEVGEHGEDE